jgi:hypothetical protein
MADGYEAIYRRMLGEEDAGIAPVAASQAPTGADRRVIDMPARTSALPPKAV